MYEEILCEEENISRIDALLDDNEYVLYFFKDKQLFAGGEDSRLTFAKMKNPDDDLPKDWEKEATFSADNLEKLVLGEPGKHVFSSRDLKKMKIIDRDEVVQQLTKIVEKLGDKAFKKQPTKFFNLSNIFQNDPDHAPNFTRADEE